MSSPDITREHAISAFKALRNICKPAPLRGDAVERLAVERDDVEPDFQPTRRLINELRIFGDENPKLVLFGSVGSGKSTELARLDRSLGHQYLIVGLDPVNSGYHRHGLDAMTTEGLILLSGLAIAHAADQVWGIKLKTELKRLESAARQLIPHGRGVTLDIGQLTRGLFLFGTTFLDPTGLGSAAAVGKGAVDLLSKTAGAVSARINLADLIGPAPGKVAAQELVDAVNGIIDAVNTRGHRAPLLLIDETDKISDPELSFHLLTRQGLIKALKCPAVIAGPNSLQGHRAHQLDGHGFSTGNQLYHVRVWQTEAPDVPDEEGVAKMEDVLRKRVAAACEQVGLPAVELMDADSRRALAIMSGGVIVDLLGLVTEAARAAVLDRESPCYIGMSHAREAIAVRRREREVFQTADHIDALREIRKRQELTGGQIGLDLLARNHVLMYSNDHPWYFPHSLLLSLLDHTSVS